MPKTLALIHTSMVFVNVETMMKDMFAEIMPDVRLINIVDDSLLPDVMEMGHIAVENVAGLQVLTSPRLAIEYTKSVLDAIAEQ